MQKKQFSPEANATGGSSASKKTAMSNMPKADADFLTLAKAVDAKWQATPTLKLLWMDQPTYKTLVTSYDTNLGNRLSVGSGRTSQTKTLAQINKQIDAAVEEVKIYITKKFKKANAAAQFAKYGIVKQSSSYRLPKDNDKRALALPLMAAAIITDGFGTEEFGTTFWKTVTTNFTAALKNTIDTTKNLSSKVAAKSTDRQKIHSVLIAIRHLIYANYPDTCDKVLREWGFIKQNF